MPESAPPLRYSHPKLSLLRSSTAAKANTCWPTTALSKTFIVSLRRHRHRIEVRVGGVLVDALLDLEPHVADEALDWPGGGVAEGADGVALDLVGDVEQHVDLAPLRPSLGHARDDAPH